MSSQALLAGAGVSAGPTVGQMMPSAPPLSNIQQPAAINQSKIEDHGPGAKQALCGTQASDGQGLFFSANESNVLMAQQALQDAPRPGENKMAPQGPAGQKGADVGAQPVMTTGAGVAVTPGARSGAEVFFDGWTGVKSRDDRLKNLDEIMLFLQTHNNRPQVSCRVHGYHMETRHRFEKDSQGNERRIEERITVTDFQYQIDLTRFVFPYGYIQSIGGKVSVPDEIKEYLVDKNKLKTFRMEKLINFNFQALASYVHNYIRGIGWWRGLSIDFPMSNYTVRVFDNNNMAACWENQCTFCLMACTVIPYCVLKCYGDWSGHKKDHCKSLFKINYDPLQVFDVIRPALYCTGYTLDQAIAEQMRDIYW